MHRVLAIAALVLCVFASTAQAGRRVVTLDGQWQIAEGNLSEAPPAVFNRSVPVPGLVDLAKPAFSEVGKASPLRQAFWYRRTFTVNGPGSGVALLKINKAMFGTKVWLNGALAGEHLGCFTPGYFDVGKLLRYGAPNTLVVRVGACRESLPPSVPAGMDGEKTIWTPGIYDSVSLILANPPYISSVQVAPHIGNGTITVQVALRGSAGVSTRLRLSVREWKSGKTAARPLSSSVILDGSGGKIITRTIRIINPRLWSPESPFLYIVRVETGTDALVARFGIREFRYDAKTGRPMLNGKPYYLRGTNFCMFRFFEDPVRGSLPWNRQWVRKLLTIPRQTLHWNSARVCIAPFPEFWYDMADELGWLLQDEYPIWGFQDSWDQAELKSEFTEWLRERWNHPSIVVWDACNETLTPRTSELARSVRGLDLSDRPWDDGYSQRQRPTDAMEIHPYTILPPKGGEDPRIGSALDKTWPGVKAPFVINEYDAFWMCRDGSGTSTFNQWYVEKLGADATLDQKRELLAYHAAAVTEYWRARRDAAAIQWFCYLTYSKPGLVTSDNFADLPKLVLKPHFVEYMHDAFSPLAVTIDDVADCYAPGAEANFQIIVTNDLDKPAKGRVELVLYNGPSRRYHWAKFSVGAYGQAFIELPMKLPDKPGTYRLNADLVAEAPRASDIVLSRRRVRIVSAEEAKRIISLADHCKVSSSSDFPGCPARFAVDGGRGTRWSSQFSDPQWISVDLGGMKRVGRVGLEWETAYGKAYKIQVSSDGRNWTDVYSTESGKGGVEEIKFEPVEARYVRMFGTARGTGFGYSLWSFQVFEE